MPLILQRRWPVREKKKKKDFYFFSRFALNFAQKSIQGSPQTSLLFIGTCP
jgi:hypothetical protein